MKQSQNNDDTQMKQTGSSEVKLMKTNNKLDKLNELDEACANEQQHAHGKQ